MVDQLDVPDQRGTKRICQGKQKFCLLMTAKVAGATPNLHLIHITNFKCGPDSYIKHFLGTACNKPVLSLQFDGHGNDAGFLTRCEAYLDSQGMLRWWRHGQKICEADTCISRA